MLSNPLFRSCALAVALLAAQPAAGAPAILINHTDLDWEVEPVLPAAGEAVLRLTGIHTPAWIRTGESVTLAPGAEPLRHTVKSRQGVRIQLEHKEGKATVPIWISCQPPGTGPRFSFLLQYQSDRDGARPAAALKEVAECPVYLAPPFRLDPIKPHVLELRAEPATDRPLEAVKVLPDRPACAIL